MKLFSCATLLVALSGDRVVQMAEKMVFEPIFEADFQGL